KSVPSTATAAPKRLTSPRASTRGAPDMHRTVSRRRSNGPRRFPLGHDRGVTDATGAVPAERLAAWLADQGVALDGPLRVEPLSGGSSNLTFRVRDGSHDWVLRRPPASHVLATAHDMGREYRVQLALGPTDVPVPHVVAHCAD